MIFQTKHIFTLAKFYLIKTLILYLFISTNLFSYIKDISNDARSLVLNNTSSNFDKNSFSNLNPSIFSKKYETFISYIPLENSETISNILLNIPILNNCFQISYSNFLSKDIEIWNDDNILIGNETYNESLISFSVARNFFVNGRKFSFGSRINRENLSIVNSTFASNTYFDLGFITNFSVLRKDFGVGVSMLNIGNNEQQKIAFGISKKIILDWYFSMVNYSNYKTDYSLSSEYIFNDNFSVFSSFITNFSGDFDLMSNLRFGTRFSFKPFNFDLAFVKRGELGFINYFTINYEYQIKKNKIKNNIEKSSFKNIEMPNVSIDNQKSNEFKKFKIGVFVDNYKYANIRDMLTKYFSQNKDLEVIDSLLMDTFFRKEDLYKKDIYFVDSKNLEDSKKELDVELIVKIYFETAKNDKIIIECFNIYTGKVFYKNEKIIYRFRDLEYLVKNMVIEFFDKNKFLINLGSTKYEYDRQEKIAKNILLNKQILEEKKQFKIKSIKMFNERRKDRILKEYKEYKIRSILRFQELRKARINAKLMEV